MARLDPHSHADSAQPRARHLKLRLAADFEARRIDGEAVLRFDAPAEGPLDLDSKALDVLSASSDSGLPVPFEVGPEQPILDSGRSIPMESVGHSAACKQRDYSNPGDG